MTNLHGYNNLPSNVRAQIGSVVGIWKSHLGGGLAGIYLHGSIALGAFLPSSGDIDILVVTNSGIPTKKRLEIAKDIIAADNLPCPLEMSAVTLSDLMNWKDPGNCVFHYSDFWRERCEKRFIDDSAECFVADHDFPDHDVTSYIRLIKERGIVLYGCPINEIFPNIPDDDFFAAISADVDDYDFHSYAPRYLSSNILILGRILSFRHEKRILLKYEAGLWMANHVPAELRYIPKAALRVWYGAGSFDFPEDDLEKLREFLIKEIKK